MTVHMSMADFTNEWDLIAYAKANPNEWVLCLCAGDDPDCACGGLGGAPAWTNDPETAGYPHERTDGT